MRHAKYSCEYHVKDRNRPLSENIIKRIVNMEKSNPSIFLETAMIFSSPFNSSLHPAILIQALSISFYKLKINERQYAFKFNESLSFINKLNDLFYSFLCMGYDSVFSIASDHLSSSNIVDLSKAATWVKI